MIIAVKIWRDLVYTTIQDNVPLQHKLIDILERDDIYEAAYWALKLKLNGIPSSVSQLLENIQQGRDSFPPEEEETIETYDKNNSRNSEPNIWTTTEATSWEKTDWSTSPWPSETSLKKDSGFYEFPLPYSDITFIDNKKRLNEFLDYLRTSTEVRINIFIYSKTQ